MGSGGARRGRVWNAKARNGTVRYGLAFQFAVGKWPGVIESGQARHGDAW